MASVRPKQVQTELESVEFSVTSLVQSLLQITLYLPGNKATSKCNPKALALRINESMNEVPPHWLAVKYRTGHRTKFPIASISAMVE